MRKILLSFAILLFPLNGLATTTYDPATFSFDSDKISGYGQGVSATCTANTTTNIDLTLNDDVIMTGAVLIVSGATLGDYIDLQVMSGSTVLATPISTWYIPTSGVIDYQMVVPKKIVSGLKLRIICHATVVVVTPYVAVNYKLWKVLQ